MSAGADALQAIARIESEATTLRQSLASLTVILEAIADRADALARKATAAHDAIEAMSHAHAEALAAERGRARDAELHVADLRHSLTEIRKQESGR